LLSSVYPRTHNAGTQQPELKGLPPPEYRFWTGADDDAAETYGQVVPE